MSFVVVETYKTKSRNITEFYVVLPGWIDGDNGIVYYPRLNAREELQKNNSKFGPGWIPRVLKKIWHTNLSYDVAEDMIDFHVQNISSAEEADANPRKKHLMSAPTNMLRAQQYCLPMPKCGNQAKQSAAVSTLEEPTIIQAETIAGTQNIDWVDGNGAALPEIIFSSEKFNYIELEQQDQHPSNEEQLPYSIENEIDAESSIRTLTAEIKSLNESINKMRLQMDATDIKINTLTTKVDGMADGIGKIFSATKNTSNFVSEYFKDEKKTSGTECKVHDAQLEDFDDLNSMEPLKSSEELSSFETALGDTIYCDRFTRFLKSKYNFASLKSKTLFGLLLRQLTSPELYSKYSWKGNSRKGINNISFATTHDVFVKYITRIVRMSDLSLSASDVEEWFAARLRQKKQVVEREKNRTVEPRLPAPRSRLPKQNLPEENPRVIELQVESNPVESDA